MKTLIEISVDSTESALAAALGGAQRIELCSGLSEGGLTPSLGLVRTVRASTAVELFAIVRPRGGDFLYNDTEMRAMREDIHILREEGIDGVVFGVLSTDGHIDVARTEELVAAAGPLSVTFHRAIDMTRDPVRALEDVIGCGVRRVLSSGGRASAWDGRETLRAMVQLAGERAHVLVGGGVRPANIGALLEATHATEFHSSMRSEVPSPMQYRAQGLALGDDGADEFRRRIVRAEDVRALVDAAQAAAAALPTLVQ